MVENLFRKPRGPKAAALLEVAAISKKGKKAQVQLELRAKWVAAEWNRDARVTYQQMIDRTMARFGIGQSMAEVAYARAREIVAASVTEFDIGRLWSKFLQISDEARAAGKFAAATKALYTGAVATGLVKPKMEINHTGRLTVNQVAHVAVLHMTPIERGHRERELLERAGLLNESVESVDQIIEGALAAIGGDASSTRDVAPAAGRVIDIEDPKPKVDAP